MADDSISSLMSEKRVFYPREDFSRNSYVKSMKEYEEIYRQSIDDPSGFWQQKADELHWFQRWHSVFRYTDKPFVKWFEGGKLNLSYNCLDRHLSTWRRNKAAIIWQGEPENDEVILTYGELHRKVCRFANVLKAKGVQRGDRVCIYMPMIPELPIAMLACARIGAIHSIVFGGFSSDALKNRLEDSEARLVVTADGSLRKGEAYPLKENVDRAVKGISCVKSVIVVRRAGNEIQMLPGRDTFWHDEMDAENISDECPAEWMDAEDSLFILYTSGTTGRPKGVLHTTGGYSVYVHKTCQWIFDLKDTDTLWCTADIGWITGHSYIVYGPLMNGSTTVMFEGIPTYPQPDRFWKIIEKFKVTIFYTAPTAIRALEKEGDKWVRKHNLASLRLLGSVGEPINPEAWMWYYNVIGNGKCPIVDTWWQTETGGILIAPFPGATPLKPGSATKPFPGIEPAILREDGSEAMANEGGYLVIKKPWPSMERTVWKNPQRYIETYFGKFGSTTYVTGDGARKDEDGYYWIMGRLDDVIKVSGHRLGTAEVESGIVSHDSVAEAAVVPFSHPVKGEAIYAFVTLKDGIPKSDALKEEIKKQVSRTIGPIARPDKVQFADALPKTRSGKIMRRILRAIAEGKKEMGDITTLSDPSVVEKLFSGRIA